MALITPCHLTLTDQQRNTMVASSFGPILSSDGEYSCLKQARSQPEIWEGGKGKLWRDKTILFTLMKMKECVCTSTILVYL